MLKIGGKGIFSPIFTLSVKWESYCFVLLFVFVCSISGWCYGTVANGKKILYE